METDKVITEEEYCRECVDYALETGWVQPEQKEVLVEKCLKPIHRKYLELLDEVEPFLREDPETDETQEIMIIRLNPILDRTQRIGSTEPWNILSSIRDHVSFNCRGYYSRYAGTHLLDKVAEVLRNN